MTNCGRGRSLRAKGKRNQLIPTTIHSEKKMNDVQSDSNNVAFRLPRLNEPAPDFHVRTTHGERQLSDYEGRWLILFSHPADFTPVCTTEFIAFAKSYPQFQALDCDLLGLSIDSTFSHLAWIRNIKEKFDVEIPFPIIEDLSMQVARDYGMIMPSASDTSAVRTTFMIDCEGILRAMVYYPMSNGRSVDEFIRLLKAMQTSDDHNVATPEGWQPGESVIVPPPETLDEANSRAEKGYEYTDWYFSKKELPREPLLES
jgi:peroxiredoxin (alkyl hydroperoxide reductase subunit C)